MTFYDELDNLIARHLGPRGEEAAIIVRDLELAALSLQPTPDERDEWMNDFDRMDDELADYAAAEAADERFELERLRMRRESGDQLW